MRLGSSSRVGALLAAACAAGCTNPTPQPPQLGNCVPTGNASCSVFQGGGGSGGGDSGLRGDAARAPDSGVDASDSAAPDNDAATSCGQADTMLAALYPGCGDCMVSPPSGGATSCCAADTACSGDSACLAILQCAIGCASGASCMAQSCGILAPLGVTHFNDLGQCIQRECSSVCPALPAVTVGDQ